MRFLDNFDEISMGSRFTIIVVDRAVRVGRDLQYGINKGRNQN